MKSLQQRAYLWAINAFGLAVVGDVQERCDRFLEESLELLQACGYDKDRVQTLVDYVYGRPIGDKKQEIGGVAITLLVLCEQLGYDFNLCGELEFQRIEQLVEQIRAKQQAKRNLFT